MTDPFKDHPIPGEATNAVTLMAADGSVTHLPDPGPVDPYLLWEGTLTERWQAWLRRGNGPYWVESDGTLVISQDTDTPDEDNLRIRPGGWATWCGDGFEEGRVVPVFMRCGWESAEVRIGWVQAPNQMPALLRSMADQWQASPAAEPLADEYERHQQ